MNRGQPAERPLIEWIEARRPRHRLRRGDCCCPRAGCEAIPPVGRFRPLERTEFEGQPGMARRDQVVAHFPRHPIGSGRAADVAARALLAADERIGEIDHAERVARRPPAGQRVGHQPVARRSMARLAADAVAGRRATAGRMAADAGGVLVGGHHGMRGIADGEQFHDPRGQRLVEHPLGPSMRVAGRPDGVAALPGRVSLHRGGMAAG